MQRPRNERGVTYPLHRMTVGSAFRENESVVPIMSPREASTAGVTQLYPASVRPACQQPGSQTPATVLKPLLVKSQRLAYPWVGERIGDELHAAKIVLLRVPVGHSHRKRAGGHSGPATIGT